MMILTGLEVLKVVSIDERRGDRCGAEKNHGFCELSSDVYNRGRIQ
jgi:hypothetical protein